MTIIAAYDDGKHIWIGTDSIGSADDFQTDFGSKLIIKENYTLSNAGSYRVGDILEECKTLPKQIRNTKDLTRFRDKLCDLIVTDDSIVKIPNNSSYANVDVLIISPHGIFVIADDFQIHKIKNGYYALGSGSIVATGVLYCAKQAGFFVNGEEVVEMACMAAIEHNANCGGEIYIDNWKKE